MGLNRLGSYLSQSIWNQNAESLEQLARAVGGRGVASGLNLTAGDNLTLHVSTGVLIDGACAREVPEAELELPPSVNRFVWMNGAGYFTFAATSEDPSGSLICLGRVFTDETSITSVTSEGRTEIARWINLRTYQVGNQLLILDTDNQRIGLGASPLHPIDVHLDACFNNPVQLNDFTVQPLLETPETPSTGLTLFSTRADSITELKLVNPEGDVIPFTRNSRPIAHGFASRTLVLTDDLVLSETDAPIQVIDPNGANRVVILPEAMDWGSFFRVINIGASHTVTVKHHDGTTIAATLGAGEMTEVTPLPDGPLPIWPIEL